MELIETSIFKKRIDQLLDGITYAQFREYLVCNPLRGKLIKHGGGLRKIRWKTKYAGKSSGIRIIYFIKSNTKIYLLYCYAKNQAVDLTREQIKDLALLVKDLQ